MCGVPSSAPKHVLEPLPFLTTTTLVIAVIATPVRVAIPIAIDSVAVLVSIRPMIGRSGRDDAAG